MVDRLTSMAVFVKVADLGSFTAAATAMGVSSQMVGKHIGLLEERLGTELIRRTTRRQSLTTIGQAFLERCRSILADMDAAESLADDLSATPRGRLRVNAPVAFGTRCLAPVVECYLDAHPDVEIELTLSDRYVEIVDEGFDAVIRLGRLQDSALLARRLAPHRLIACAAPIYLQRYGAPTTPVELVEHECLRFVYSSGLAYSDWPFTRAGHTEIVEVRGRFQTNDARVLHDAAVAGQGIVLQAESVVRDDLAAGRLVRVLPDHAGPTRPMHILFSASRRQTPKLRTFVDWIAKAFADEACL